MDEQIKTVCHSDNRGLVEKAGKRFCGRRANPSLLTPLLGRPLGCKYYGDVLAWAVLDSTNPRFVWVWDEATETIQLDQTALDQSGIEDIATTASEKKDANEFGVLRNSALDSFIKLNCPSVKAKFSDVNIWNGIREITNLTLPPAYISKGLAQYMSEDKALANQMLDKLIYPEDQGIQDASAYMVLRTDRLLYILRELYSQPFPQDPEELLAASWIAKCVNLAADSAVRMFSMSNIGEDRSDLPAKFRTYCASQSFGPLTIGKTDDFIASLAASGMNATVAECEFLAAQDLMIMASLLALQYFRQVEDELSDW